MVVIGANSGERVADNRLYYIFSLCLLSIAFTFNEFFRSAYFHITGSVTDRVCWVNEVAVPPL